MCFGFGSCCSLTALALCRTNLCLLLILLLPSLHCEKLGCFFSLFMTRESERETKFALVKTYCPDDHLCFKADARYADQSILTARGCLKLANCSQVDTVRYLGTVYELSYACCDWPYCNSSPGVTAGLLHVSAALLAAAVVTGSV